MLVFFSGTSAVPPLGFLETPTLSFTNGNLATSSSDIQLRLPLSHGRNYTTFKDAMLLSIYVTRSEKTYHFAQKLKKRYKQKSRKKSFFNTKLFLAYLKIQLLGYLLAKFQHLNRYSFAKRAAQRELLLFSSRGRLYVNGN